MWVQAVKVSRFVFHAPVEGDLKVVYAEADTVETRMQRDAAVTARDLANLGNLLAADRFAGQWHPAAVTAQAPGVCITRGKARRLK